MKIKVEVKVNNLAEPSFPYWEGTENTIDELRTMDLSAWLVATCVVKFGGTQCMKHWKATEVKEPERVHCSDCSEQGGTCDFYGASFPTQGIMCSAFVSKSL